MKLNAIGVGLCVLGGCLFSQVIASAVFVYNNKINLNDAGYNLYLAGAFVALGISATGVSMLLKDCNIKEQNQIREI